MNIKNEAKGLMKEIGKDIIKKTIVDTLYPAKLQNAIIKDLL